MIRELLEKNSSILLILLWGAVSGYFVARWVRHRKIVSIGMAVMALGWPWVAAPDLLGPRLWEYMGPAMKVVSFLLGAFVVYAIVRVEKSGK